MAGVAVVGAGVGGLAVAADLGRLVPVTVVERLPAVGGSEHFDDPFVRELEGDCRTAGVRFLLGTTALRWREGRLLVAAPGRIEWLDADWLVYAGGRRPATPAELRLLGSRLGGVLSATVAFHLLEAAVDLGRRPVILGISDWAERVAEVLRHQDVDITVVSPEQVERPAYADAWWPGWTPERVVGAGRVSELIVGHAGHRERLVCDSVILADGIRPLRNVEGAILGGDHVIFAQHGLAHSTPAGTADRARAAVAELIGIVGRQAS